MPGKWKKRISMKMQLRKVKIMKIKAWWGPLKVWGPRGSIPPTPFLSVGLLGTRQFISDQELTKLVSQSYHYLPVCVRAVDHQGMVKTSLSLLQSWGDRFEVCSLLLCQNTLDRVHVWECGSCNWQGHPLPVPPRRKRKNHRWLHDLYIIRNELVKEFLLCISNWAPGFWPYGISWVLPFTKCQLLSMNVSYDT